MLPNSIKFLLVQRQLVGQLLGVFDIGDRTVVGEDLALDPAVAREAVAPDEFHLEDVLAGQAWVSGGHLWLCLYCWLRLV